MKDFPAVTRLTPMDIHDSVLERSGQAMARGDYTAFRACVSLPTVVETFERRVTFTTEAQIHRFFDQLMAQRQVSNIQHLMRRSLTAEFKGPDRIWAAHETRSLAHGVQIVGPAYVAFTVLRRDAGIWRIAFSQYAVEGANHLNRALSLSSGLGRCAGSARPPEAAHAFDPRTGAGV